MRLKHFALLSLGFLFTISSKAQFKKGMQMAGTNVGSVLFNSGSSDITVAQIGSNRSKITGYNVSILPTMGWFTTDNTVFGASLNINPSGTKTTYEQSGSTYQSDKITNFNIGLGGFVRHYLKHTGRMIPFGQFGINAGISNLKTDGFFYGGAGTNAYKITSDGNSNGGFFFNSTFQAGMTKMVGDFTGLDFYIGYNFSYNKNVFKRTTLRDNGNDGTIDERGESETTNKFTNHGFLLGVGFQVFLKGKTK